MADCSNYISADDLKTGKQAIQHIEHVAKSKDANGADALTVTDTIGTETVTDRTLKGIKADGDAVVEETRQNLIPLSRQYMTLADAQADIANIPEGSTTYVRSSDDDALAVEYMNVAGTLQPTGRKMLSYDAVKNLLPLNDTTIFQNDDSGEFEFGYGFTVVLLDKNKDIVYGMKSKTIKWFLNSQFTNIESDTITVAGVLLETKNIPSTDEKEALTQYANNTKILDPNEFEFGYGFTVVLLDKNKDIVYGMKSKTIKWFLNSQFTNIESDTITVAGVLLETKNIPSTDEKEALTQYANNTKILDPNEFEFNPDQIRIVDKDNNVLLDFVEYNNKKKNWDEAWEITQQIKPQETNPLCPWSEPDSNGKYQVSVMDISTHQQIQVTSGTSNETNPRPDVLDRIVWQSDRADPPPGGLFYAQLPDFTPHAYIARKKIVGWGHSFINNGAFLNRLRALTGLPTYNFGLSGQTSDAIAARQGGDPAHYAPVGGTIPASGAVTLTPSVPGPCRSLAAPVALKCNLAGVDGTFTWDGTSAVFTRETAGDAVPVSVQVPLFVYPITTVNVSGSIPSGTQFDLHDECINIFWIGRNNLSETDLIMQNLDAMVKYVKPIGEKILILAEFNSSSEPTGSSGYNQMVELNHRYQDKYPDFYCGIGNIDIRQNFINHANPASSGDMEDVAAGLTPRSLRYDPLHPSQQITGNGGSLTPELALDYGANVNATFTRDVLNNKGWL